MQAKSRESSDEIGICRQMQKFSHRGGREFVAMIVPERFCPIAVPVVVPVRYYLQYL
jgi:hypothetical protein